MASKQDCGMDSDYIYIYIYIAFVWAIWRVKMVQSCMFTMVGWIKDCSNPKSRIIFDDTSYSRPELSSFWRPSKITPLIVKDNTIPITYTLINSPIYLIRLLFSSYTLHIDDDISTHHIDYFSNKNARLLCGLYSK
jgi:hypothetical protein